MKNKLFYCVTIALLLQSCSNSTYLLTKWKYRKDYKVINNQNNKSKSTINKQIVDSLFLNISDSVEFLASTNKISSEILTEKSWKTEPKLLTSQERKVKKEAINNHLKSISNKNKPQAPFLNKKLREDTKKTHVGSLVGFILSIVSYPFVYIGALIAIAAVILGIVGMVKISKNPDLYSNRWMAITAIILGGILLLLYALVIYILLMTLA